MQQIYFDKVLNMIIDKFIIIYAATYIILESGTQTTTNSLNRKMNLTSNFFVLTSLARFLVQSSKYSCQYFDLNQNVGRSNLRQNICSQITVFLLPCLGRI